MYFLSFIVSCFIVLGKKTELNRVPPGICSPYHQQSQSNCNSSFTSTLQPLPLFIQETISLPCPWITLQTKSLAPEAAPDISGLSWIRHPWPSTRGLECEGQLPLSWLFSSPPRPLKNTDTIQQTCLGFYKAIKQVDCKSSCPLWIRLLLQQQSWVRK